MATINSIHFLLVAPPSWGHVRPACQLALRLLECDERIVVTVMVPPNMMAKSQAEVVTYAGSTDSNSRLRVLTTFEFDDPNPIKFMQPFFESFSVAYKTLHEGKSITCAAIKVAYDPVSAPVAVVIDSFMAPVMFATRALTGASVPVVCFATGSALSIIRLWGPESLGGLGDFTAKVVAEAQLTGESQNETGGKLFRRTRGSVVNIPGLPPMYDHEFFPQDTPVSGSVFMLLKSGQAFFEHCDSVLLSSSYVLEGEAMDAFKAWLSESKKEVYGVGPLLPANYWDVQSDGDATEVQVFLDSMLESRGKKSVVLISFGSHVWPTVQDYVDETILALIEQKIPFILCHPSSRAVIPLEIVEKITSSGLGILSSWIPQQYVLAHPATGWFLTHGGQGGVTEALANGVPLICWPIEGDQVVTSVHTSVNLGVNFELVEVRSGDGLKPIHRLGDRTPKGTPAAMAAEVRGVLSSAFGETGAQMRTKAEDMQNKLKKSWDEDGIAIEELRAFVAKFK